MNGDYIIYYVIAGAFTMIGMFLSNRLKSKFNYYSQFDLGNGLSGREVAEKMLSQNGISDVKVVRGEGFLTDHYNPQSLTVSLSPPVYDGRSISSAAVAAHECGHAVQHATDYPMLRMRSNLVPFVKFASIAQGYMLMFALGMAGAMPGLLLITIAAFAVTALFSLVTLPVEFDASKRAMNWLDDSGITSGEEQAGAKDALWWAAMTYVSAALSSFVILAFLVLKYMGGRR